MTLRRVGDRPIVTRGDGPPGHAAVLPGATAVDADGSIVAFLVWFGAARGDQVVTLARSTDGRTWSVDPDPIYTDLGLGLTAPGPIPGAALRMRDGSWVLYGWGATPRLPRSFSTWRATASRPEGPWTASPLGTVLGPGPRGSWDDETAAVSAVLPSGGGFEMWYEGQRPGTTIRGGIGQATSTDGVAWTRWDDPTTPATGDAVLGPGACGPGTAAASLSPQVWRHGDGYLMLFGGTEAAGQRERVFGATSRDGRTWSCTGEALLTQDDIPGSEGIHTIQGATIAGEPALIVESLHDGGSELWLVSVTVGS